MKTIHHFFLYSKSKGSVFHASVIYKNLPILDLQKKKIHIFIGEIDLTIAI